MKITPIPYSSQTTANQGPGGEPPLKLDGDAIMVIKTGSASALIVVDRPQLRGDETAAQPQLLDAADGSLNQFRKLRLLVASCGQPALVFMAVVSIG